MNANLQNGLPLILIDHNMYSIYDRLTDRKVVGEKDTLHNLSVPCYWPVCSLQQSAVAMYMPYFTDPFLIDASYFLLYAKRAVSMGTTLIAHEKILHLPKQSLQS